MTNVIPLYTTPVPAANLVNELNNIISQVNANFQSAVYNALNWATSRFYGLPRGATPSTLLTTASTIYAYPLYIPGNTPIKTISTDSTTGQTGGSVHVGLYADNFGTPGALVANSDSGALAATGTAIATATYTTPLTLSPGWYWLATTAAASSTMPTLAAIATSYTSELAGEIGIDTAAHAFATASQNASGVTATFTFGALPATFPSAGLALNIALAVPMVVLGT